jgi:hypothetical protein
MLCRLWLPVALGTLLGVAGCSNLRTETAATAPVAAPAAPTALTAPPVAPPTATLAPAPTPIPEERLAAVEPVEIQGVMVELSLAHALDICGFPALGQFMRDFTQQKVESCPNSAARKAALREVVASAALRNKRLDEQTGVPGSAPHCEQSDKLRLIKEMIPIAQHVVAAADKPLDCSRISRAEP